MNPVIHWSIRPQVPMSKNKDQRAFHRYSIRVPLRYRVVSLPHSHDWKQGHTLNMSAGGLFADVPERVPWGTRLKLEVDWPGLYHDRQIVRLILLAEVIRVDRRGTALRILRRQFRDVLPAARGSRRLGRERSVA